MILLSRGGVPWPRGPCFFVRTGGSIGMGVHWHGRGGGGAYKGHVTCIQVSVSLLKQESSNSHPSEPYHCSTSPHAIAPSSHVGTHAQHTDAHLSASTTVRKTRSTHKLLHQVHQVHSSSWERAGHSSIKASVIEKGTHGWGAMLVTWVSRVFFQLHSSLVATDTCNLLYGA